MPIPLLLLIVCLGLALVPATAKALDLERLDARIQALSDEAGTGVLGVGILELATGRRYFHNGSRRFPMQSVYKVPIAIAVLRRIDEGALSHATPIVISPTDLSIPYSPIARHLGPQGRAFSVRDLLEHAVGRSDNTASDVLLRLAGGASDVTAMLSGAGYPDIRVDRLERELQPDLLGLGPFRSAWTDWRQVQASLSKLAASARRQALAIHLSDPRDTATPAAMVELLADLHAGRILSPASTRILLQIMTRSPTGAKRLKAGLPSGSSLAHKTGTSMDVLGTNAATNDVGIATLPGGRTIVLAVFLAGSDRPAQERERIIADVARAAVESMAGADAPD